MESLNAFDPVAGFYDVLADTIFFGRVFRAQTRYLDQIKPGSKILILGGGTGRILPPLFKQNPDITVWYIEASAEMLKKSRKQLKGGEDVIFVHGTEANLPDHIFDVIILPFFLDMFGEPDLSGLSRKLLRSSREGSVWLVSDFVKTRWWHNPLLFVMYRFFNLLCKVKPHQLPPWQELLKRAVGNKIAETTYYGGFISATVFYVTTPIDGQRKT